MVTIRLTPLEEDQAHPSSSSSSSLASIRPSRMDPAAPVDLPVVIPLEHTVGVEQRRYVRFTLALSWICIAVTLGFGILGLALAGITHSKGMLAWGVSNLVDMLASVAIVWVFWPPGKTAGQDQQQVAEKRVGMKRVLKSSGA